MNAPPVIHNPGAQRFECGLGTERAECSYVRRGDVLVLHHTQVPPALQGRGLAAQLVRVTLAWARENHLHVQPDCSYVAGYIARHPETQDLLAPGGSP